jgi:Protein of unknown function (DUF1549)/Protein of unknown function (DUF1553)
MRAFPLSVFIFQTMVLVPPVCGAVSFEREVMAVISKAGCNAGACHGNLNGKGGFKLSLRGGDPAADFEALVTQKPGRRVNLQAVESSLILRKPTLTIEHEGGRRFAMDSFEYRVLRDWIAAGATRDSSSAPRLVDLRVTPPERVLMAPEAEVALRVEAVFSDSSVQDVTRLATYEPFSFQAGVSVEGVATRKDFGEVTIGVRYLHLQKPVSLAFVRARPGFVWSRPSGTTFIDEHVFAKLQRLRMNPSSMCDDATFLRRVSIDLVGRPPTADEARAFLAEAAPDKRAALVNRWLERPEFADFWALKWADLLRVEEKALDARGMAFFHGWIRERIAENQPLDRFVRDILTARGSTYEVAPANYYRSLREPTARSEAVAQVFLGTRVGCAKCHNHPYERWTQDDYYRFAALFDRIDYDIKENKATDKFDKHMFVGEQVVKLTEKTVLDDPRTKKPPVPGLLMPDAPPVDPARDRFDQLAEWLTSRNNQLFSRVQANRIWFHLLGRGIVDPPDDFRATNPPSIPALLDALAEDFARSGYDLRHLIRTICASQTYQLDSTPNDTNAADVANFSHAAVRRLDAESLVDAVCQFLGVDPPVTIDGKSMTAVQMPGLRLGRRDDGSEINSMLVTFGKPRRLVSSDVERTDATSLGQVFTLTSGPLVARWIAQPDNRLGRLLASGASDAAIVDELYSSALTRPPTEVEAAVCRGKLAAALTPEARRSAAEDIAWALLNAKEFVLRR